MDEDISDAAELGHQRVVQSISPGTANCEVHRLFPRFHTLIRLTEIERGVSDRFLADERFAQVNTPERMSRIDVREFDQVGRLLA
jgi:hypothetical protein